MNLIKKIFHFLRVKYIKKIFLKKKISNKEKFSLIYKTNYWSDPESISGSGSNKKQTLNTIINIKRIIEMYNIRRIFDVPCGDFVWMDNLLQQMAKSNDKKINYIGGDIVEDLIYKLKQKYLGKNYEFRCFDITKDKIENSDLVICRDCFIHFSNDDIFKSINNFLNSNCKYFLISDSVVNEKFENGDINTGEYRKIDLTKKPFNLPIKNLVQFNDVYNENLNSYETRMTLWSKKQLKRNNGFK